jgi:predicted nucleotide-binding protein
MPEKNSMQLQEDIRRLQSRIRDLEEFDPTEMTEVSPLELQELSRSIEETLAGAFGRNTDRYKTFFPEAALCSPPSTIFPPYLRLVEDEREHVNRNKKVTIDRLQKAVGILRRKLSDVEPPQGRKSASAALQPAPSKKVFLVHGRDDTAKEQVAKFLRRIGLDEIILHERPNKGRHLLIKFQEECEGAGFAVVLMTPDDVGGLSHMKLHQRARQNVVFELGFFIGRLGTPKVAALVKGDIERPSDFDGIGYISLDEAGNWKSQLAQELEAAAVPFDHKKVPRKAPRRR